MISVNNDDSIQGPVPLLPTRHRSFVLVEKALSLAFQGFASETKTARAHARVDSAITTHSPPLSSDRILIVSHWYPIHNLKH